MPILDPNTLEFFSRSPEQTRRVGMRLGALLNPGDLVCLQGDFGAGKTTLVQGLAQGWGSLDAVSSPTFVLVNVYRRSEKEQLFHLDTYRINSNPEAEELDLDMMLGQGALVIEWPDRVQAILPIDRLWIRLDYIDDQQRQMTFCAFGKNYERMISDLRHELFGVG